MAGLEFYIEFDEMPVLVSLENLENMDMDELLAGLAGEGVGQTQRRLQHEKESPDGEAWPAWSEDYAETRTGAHSLLINSNQLVHSIEPGMPDGDEIAWGSNEDYAAVQNFGHEFDHGTVPQRQYLGLSDTNQREMEDVALRFINDVL